MAKAIFTKLFNFTDSKKGTSWKIQPSEKPQSFPVRVIEAAVAAGAAHPPDAGTTKAPADDAGNSEG